MAEGKQSIEELIIEEWLKRPLDKRKDCDLYWLCDDLEKNRPELLKSFKSGQKVRGLREILRGFIEQS